MLGVASVLFAIAAIMALAKYGDFAEARQVNKALEKNRAELNPDIPKFYIDENLEAERAWDREMRRELKKNPSKAKELDSTPRYVSATTFDLPFMTFSEYIKAREEIKPVAGALYIPGVGEMYNDEISRINRKYGCS